MSEIRFRERDDFFKITAYVRGPENGEFEAAFSGSYSGSRVAVVSVAATDEDGSVTI
jgi:hypothetical protein